MNIALKGHYSLSCSDKEGNIRWFVECDNLVMTLGKTEMLAVSMKGSATTVAPFMGLISSINFTQIQASDTLGVAGWNEAGAAYAPVFSNRATVSFSAPVNGEITTASPCSFTMTAGGTIQGVFQVNYGATNAIEDTAGVLFSAGELATPQSVNAGDVVSVVYSLQMS
jgi:hypothetical protein